MSKKTIPSVSIIIPMYNAEKYIGECLDSILAQTFQDFEVIVVDDCSTDNSREVVKSYMPKFNNEIEDKLKLICLSKNSGAPGIPNNIGLSVSRGEYISFLEADDLIKNTAYEELYPIAKKFDADVVHCERYFQFKDGDKNFTLEGYQTGKLVEHPTLITDNFGERLNELFNRRFIWNLWTKLIRRDFITENGLKMIDANAHDAIYTCCLICTAKRYVRVPNIINFYRILENSMSHVKVDISKTVKRWMDTLTKGFKCLNDLLVEKDFYQKNPELRFLALEIWVRECCGYLLKYYAQIPAHVLDELVLQELEKVKDKTALTAFLFSRMNIFNVKLNRQNEMIQQMNAYIQNQNKVLNQQQEQIKQFQAQLQK